MINLKDEHKKVIEFTRVHCHFHYQASYEYYNLASILFRQGKYDDAIFNIDKSINLYRQNVDSFYLKGMISYIRGDVDADEYFDSAVKFNKNYDNQYNYVAKDVLRYEDNDNFSPTIIDNRNTEISPISNDLYNELKEAIDLDISLGIASKIISKTASLHFDYHLDLACMYFNIGEMNYKNENFYEAIFFLEKALECDAKNPKNAMYAEFVKKIRDTLR